MTTTHRLLSNMQRRPCLTTMDVILKSARALRNASANLSTSLKRYFKETVLLKENIEIVRKHKHTKQRQNCSALLDSSFLFENSIRIKHVFLCSNICSAPRVGLKPEPEMQGF